MSVDDNILFPSYSYGTVNSTDKLMPLLDASLSSMDSSASDGSRLYSPDFSYISTDMTAEAIRKCERYILTPYSNVLKMIGWLPYRTTVGGYLWQAILVVIWSLCILATMVTQVVSCFKRDAFVNGRTINEITDNPPINGELDYDLMEDTTYLLGNETTFSPITLGPSIKVIMCNKHIVSSLILLNVVVFANYFFGVYLFTRGETEYLFGLASHVFIKNAEADSSSKRLIQTIGGLYICGAVWLFFSLCVRIMNSLAAGLFDSMVVIEWEGSFMLSGAVKIALLVFSLFGFFTFDLVYIFSIMNYVAQGEMNIYLLWDVRRLIEVKKYDHIDGAIKDTQKCKRYLDILNGKTATLTALALFVLGNLAMSAIIDLNNMYETNLLIRKPYRVVAGVSSVLNVVCWSLLVSLPFIQAARITYWCDRLIDLGPEIRGRVYAAYADARLLDLDSLLSYLMHVKLRASIFGIPIYPWLLYLVTVIFSFTMLVLFQTDFYRIAKYI